VVDPAEAAAREQARKDLTAVKAQIHQLTMDLLTADPVQVPAMTQRLQRLRIAMLMLREIVEDVADPHAHRELTLLQKMMAGQSGQSDGERPEQQEEQAARERLTSVGVDPAAAGQLVRVLQALQAAMDHPSAYAATDDDTPQPPQQPS
jgi:hypothetical protein